MRSKYTRACVQCGKAFRPDRAGLRRGGGKYCSQLCHGAAVSRPVAERFWAKVNKHSGLFWNGSECWLWTAGCNRRGYGMFGLTSERIVLAHRFAYSITIGPIPAKLFCLHGCDTPACVNPAHLHPGTHRDNMREMRERGRSCTGERHNSHTHPGSVPRGGRHHFAKLTETDVRTIRHLYTVEGVSSRVIARRYGISDSYVCGLARRRAWRHVA
jgi:hypothetical protein